MESSNQDNNETSTPSSTLAAPTDEVLDQPKSEAATAGDGQGEATPLQVQEPTSTDMMSEAPKEEEENDKEDPKRKRGPPLETPNNEDAKPPAKRLRSSSMTDAKPDDSVESESKTSVKTTDKQESSTTQSATTNGAAAEKPDKPTKPLKKKPKDQQRWRVHQMAEDYVELASNMMLFPTAHLGSYGYDDNATIEHQVNGEGVAPTTRQPQKYPLELISSLGFLKSPLRRPTVIETWSPYEIAMFEAGMGHYGKEFYEIHKLIKTKSTKEVIDFYYIWKKTKHYGNWKKSYVAPLELATETDDVGNTPVKKTTR